MTPPKGTTRIQSTQASAAEVATSEGPNTGRLSRRRALVVDLAGDESAAHNWAAEQFPRADVSVIHKANLKSASRLSIIADLRKQNPDAFGVFTSDLAAQNRLTPLLLVGAVSGATLVLAGDKAGRTLSRSRLRVFLLDTPKMIVELALGYGLLVPLSWLLTNVLSLEAHARSTSRLAVETKRPGSRAVLYVRALPVASAASITAAGGMTSHVAGFADAARSLGNSIAMLTCGLTGVDESYPAMRIRTSNLFSATRALFELWNNLFFTYKAVKWVSDAGVQSTGRFDFIYQRYSRFNWTGVVLSAATGLPLLLEVNGSEVWVSRNWDPIGQMWLLKRFEKLNLGAADAVFTVSEIERRKLIEAGAAADRVFVNPNGADADRFRPGCGGDLIRKQLGIEGKVVIGFTGTFGPWHGTEVLARAATLLKDPARFHLLFVGDGDLRPATKAIIESAQNVTATFVGRVPHSDVPSYLDACDILVSPHTPLRDGSEFFGSPTKLFEYLAMAKPVIASRLGQIADVIRDGETGLLVEPGDELALASSIERMAGDPDLANRIASAARRSVIERHTWRHNAARVFDALENIVEGMDR